MKTATTIFVVPGFLETVDVARYQVIEKLLSGLGFKVKLVPTALVAKKLIKRARFIKVKTAAHDISHPEYLMAILRELE